MIIFQILVFYGLSVHSHFLAVEILLMHVDYYYCPLNSVNILVAGEVYESFNSRLNKVLLTAICLICPEIQNDFGHLTLLNKNNFEF